MVSFQIYRAYPSFCFVFIDENVETPLIYSKWCLDLYYFPIKSLMWRGTWLLSDSMPIDSCKS